MTTLRYTPTDPNDPYRPLIEQFLGRAFPTLHSAHPDDVLASVVEEFFATKQYRIGPRPSPESEVRIRAVARRAIADGQPIPLLIPAASLKVPLGQELDLAELSALRVLGCLQERISAVYAPGLVVRMRLEDLTECVISRDVPDLPTLLAAYQQQLHQLVRVLDYPWLRLVPESSMTSSALFADRSGAAAQLFLDYLTQGNEDARRLESAGWVGGVSAAMRSYLLGRYAVLYSGESRAQHLHRMADYLGTILARRQLRATGAFIGGQWELSFAPALPDTPADAPRVYYRTVPRSQSSLHLPFWGAKGHLRVSQRGARLALAHFGDATDEFTPGHLTLHDKESGHDAVTIRADYVLE